MCLVNIHTNIFFFSFVQSFIRISVVVVVGSRLLNSSRYCHVECSHPIPMNNDEHTTESVPDDDVKGVAKEKVDRNKIKQRKRRRKEKKNYSCNVIKIHKEKMNVFETEKKVHRKVVHSIRDFIECCEKLPVKKTKRVLPYTHRSERMICFWWSVSAFVENDEATKKIADALCRFLMSCKSVRALFSGCLSLVFFCLPLPYIGATTTLDSILCCYYISKNFHYYLSS